MPIGGNLLSCCYITKKSVQYKAEKYNGYKDNKMVQA